MSATTDKSTLQNLLGHGMTGLGGLVGGFLAYMFSDSFMGALKEGPLPIPNLISKPLVWMVTLGGILTGAVMGRKWGNKSAEEKAAPDSKGVIEVASRDVRELKSEVDTALGGLKTEISACGSAYVAGVGCPAKSADLSV